MIIVEGAILLCRPAGVVAGAGDEVHVVCSRVFRRRCERGQRARDRTLPGRNGRQASIQQPTPSASQIVAASALTPRASRSSFGLFRRANVDGKHHFAGQDVARIGREERLADAADGARLLAHRHGWHHFKDAGHGEAGVDAHGHRRRARHGFLAGEGEFQPPQALPAGDDAYLPVLGLEDRALLDVGIPK